MRYTFKHFAGLGIGFVAFLLFAFTGARTIQWQDSAQFTYRISSGTLWNEYGLAMVHPLHFWLGRFVLWIFPGPDPWAVSLASALGGGVSVGLLFACVLRLTGKKFAALFSAGTLLFAHSFWRFSGLPEVYTLSAALLLAEVFFYLQLKKHDHPTAWWGLFLINGLGLANHNLALLSLSVWGITFLLWAKDRAEGSWRPFANLLPMGIFWLLGALPYLLIVGLELRFRPAGDVLHSALFGEGFKDQVTGLFPEPGILFISLCFMLLSFPVFALPLAGRAVLKRLSWVARMMGEVAGGGNPPIQVKMDRGRLPGRGSRSAQAGAPISSCSFPLPILAITGLHLVFFLRYNVIDQYTFLIPVYALIALMAGVGFSTLSSPRWRRIAWICLVAQPFFYAAVPSLAKQSGVLESFDRKKPYRDDYRYLFLPWQMTERSAERVMLESFGTAGSEGVIVVEDPMAVYAAKWMRLHLGLEESVILLEPAEGLVESLPEGAVWIPRRTDTPLPEGWKKQGDVWIR